MSHRVDQGVLGCRGVSLLCFYLAENVSMVSTVLEFAIIGSYIAKLYEKCGLSRGVRLNLGCMQGSLKPAAKF
jgi:hypothetical protein